MKVKLLKSVLVGPSDVIPPRVGTVVDLPDDEARQFIAGGLAVAVSPAAPPQPPINPPAKPQEASTKK
jgi:hypothetical protein